MRLIGCGDLPQVGGDGGADVAVPMGPVKLVERGAHSRDACAWVTLRVGSAVLADDRVWGIERSSNGAVGPPMPAESPRRGKVSIV